MRAMVLRSNHLAVEETPVPAPGAGQVLARVRACGVCGSDLHYARYAGSLRDSSAAEQGILSRAGDGVIMGHEFVAEIASVGDGVSGWESGDRVVSMPLLIGDGGTHNIGYSSDNPGAYGEFMLLSAALLLRVPDGMPDSLAAVTEPCAVALHAVREAGVQKGDRALVMGAGPIGLLTMLWLKHEGLSVAISDPAGSRRELARSLGADMVLDPSRGEMAAGLGDFGGPPSTVFECVGVEGTLQEAMTLVARRGRVIVAGVCMVEDRIRPLLAINKHLTLHFVLGYTPGEFAEALASLASGAIAAAPVVTRTVLLDQLPEAFAALSDPSDCKVLLEFPEVG